MLTPATMTHSTAPNQNKRSSKAPAQSLNHLLNFSLPPRQSHHNQSIPRRARKIGNQYGVWNKERFVNAQYRFLMNPTGDYTVHFADPDIYFQWHDILQVIIPRGHSVLHPERQSAHDDDILTCPICLSPPTAPRMTKCGHVFCYPCMLHLLSTSEQLKWVRCPICFDSVNERQLKAVKWLDEVPAAEDVDDSHIEGSSSSTSLDRDQFAAPRSGATLRMRLIQRPQITTLALPRSTTWPSDLMPPHQAPFHFLPDVLAFAKFMLATPSELIQDLSKDLDDLATERRLLWGMGDELGAVFIDAADAKVRHQIEKASALETPHLREAIETARHVARQFEDRSNLTRHRKAEAPSLPPEEVPEAFLAAQGPGYVAPQPSRESAPTPTGRNQRQRRNLNPPPPSTSTYYYYQAANGLPIFLHPLDIKILFSHFHSYPAFPDEITVRVESYTESTVNDDLRKRCKYLGHLPEGADVTFIEADLSLVVGADGLRPFENALRTRRARRKEKGKRDDKARARAEEREKEKLAQTWHEFGYAPPAPVSVPLDIVREDPDFAAAAAAATDAPGGEPEEDASSSPPQPAGAWGARSFASAATAAQGRAQQAPRPAAVRNNRGGAEDEWELDMAFHELEQRSAKGGGKKRNNRMVILGGGGGRRAR
ncbi:hypothetical protein DICSQDRAFT_142653 [Dichomitus squalens LYAD-421 SS1]|uniref:uncharacterized protein n=1 Tax=Dichomitus squalens (strain LYAD-421) TaxID=732165 RepID=UPI00044114A4|nr:uncharacterized protein DICSQDRAFT_142653 [Dichomitus squalens LYAD-421 SS1]EJF67079.1 hypothetical protein DICSQDRAFT_142653 [Dichomitus squalens LYAD-421 SS1]